MLRSFRRFFFRTKDKHADEEIACPISEVIRLRREGLMYKALDAMTAIYEGNAADETIVHAMFWQLHDTLNFGKARRDKQMALGLLTRMETALCAYHTDDDRREDMHEALCECRAIVDDIPLEQESTPPLSHIEFGQWGEGLAAVFLREKGYIIIDCGWRNGHRDIDIVAMHNDVYVFVEVKTRKRSAGRAPVEAVDFRKRKNLRDSIRVYLHYNNITDRRWRLDVISIVGHPGQGKPIIEHIENFSIAESPGITFR